MPRSAPARTPPRPPRPSPGWSALAVLAALAAPVACSEVAPLPIPGGGTGAQGGAIAGTGSTGASVGGGGPGAGGSLGGGGAFAAPLPVAPIASSPGAIPALMPTFYRDLLPLLQKHCQSCHAPGQIAPFSLHTLDEARAVAGLMAQRTADRTMPPWGAQATSACAPRFGWKHDISLTDAEIAVFQGWAAASAPAGAPADAPAPLDPGDGTDEPFTVDLTVQPQEPYPVGGEGDVYRCFVIDPQLTEDRYLNGLRIVAGIPSMIHHVLVVADSKGLGEKKMDADGGYPCFGDPEVGSRYLASWTPGGGVTQFPPDAGFALSAGTKLVMQIHYHPGGAPTQSDLTKLDLHFTAGPPAYVARLVGVGNFVSFHLDGTGLLPGPDDYGPPVFLIPADVHGHTETMRFRVPAGDGGGPLPEMAIYDVKPHMHHVGSSIRVDVHRPSPPPGQPAKECLVAAPHWDFSWQRAYSYAAPLAALPTLRTGDEVEVRCTYDNTVDNKALVKALLLAHLPGPIDVPFGNDALDEMCFAVLTLFSKAEPSP